jgi:hypothetical protein
MQTAGIVVDAWKLPIFERHLGQSGYAWENKGAFTPDTLVLHVKTENLEALAGVVKAANTEAAMTRAPK